MQDSLITNNVISQSYKDKKIINVLYKKNNSLIDQIFFEFKNINFFDEEYIKNSVTNYDCLLGCDPLEHFSLINKYKSLHIKNIIYIIYGYPSFLKKEDKFLLQNQISNSNKIVSINRLQQDWGLPNSQVVQFGIPKNINKIEPEKDILVLNLENNSTITNIYNNIKQLFNNSDILYKIPDDISIQNLYTSFSKYKVILDLNSIVNGLVALESGSNLLTSNEYLLDDGAFVLKDINNLYNDLKLVLESSKTTQQYKISEKYDFNTFESNLIKNILQFISEPFIYE